MRLGVNVPNFGPGTNPDVLRRWALTVEGLGFDLLMMSDHIAVTPDVRLGDAWHPLRFTPGWLAEAADRLKASATEQQRPLPALMPRIALRLTRAPVTDGTRLAGHGTIDQIAEDLDQLRSLGAGTVVLDPFNGDQQETAHPETAWQALATVAERWNQQESKDIDAERS